MTVTIGSGLGGFVAIAPQPTYGANVVTPTRFPPFEKCSFTFDQKMVQGGPYLRGGSIGDVGTARLVLTPIVSTTSGPTAKGTLTGHMQNTGMALLLATAFGSSGVMTQFSATTAYGLGGSGGITLGKPDALNGGSSGCCFDMQLGAPTDDGTVHPFTFHSCMITKAEWVFDRSGLVSYTYDWDAAFVEPNTALISIVEPTSFVPFAMQNASCLFEVGTLGAEAALSGIRKTTVTLERKLAVDGRLYLGQLVKKLPVSNGNVKLAVSMDADYTAAGKTAIFDLQAAGTPQSIICTSVGNAIGSSGHNDTFSLGVTNAFVDTGGEAPLEGPEIIKNTITWSGTIDAANDAQFTASLVSADTGF